MSFTIRMKVEWFREMRILPMLRTNKPKQILYTDACRYAGRLTEHRKHSIDLTQTRHNKIKRKVRKKGSVLERKLDGTRWRAIVRDLWLRPGKQSK